MVEQAELLKKNKEMLKNSTCIFGSALLIFTT
jgi:hypothetical protein